MNATEYKYLEDTLTGRRGRDPAYESRMTPVKTEGSIAKAALERERLNASKTHEEREIEQRQFSLRMFGRENMKRYAHPIQCDHPLGELQIEGDVIMGSAPQIKGHKAEVVVEPCMDANGRLRLQTHGAIKQVLQLM
jgi:hypothetical protein